MLNGDPSDNVYGVNGLGPVRIERLLDEHRTLRAIMDHGEQEGILGKMRYKDAEEVIQRNVVLMRLTNHPLLTEQDHEDVKMCVSSTWNNAWDVDALVEEFNFDRHELNTMIILGGKQKMTKNINTKRYWIVWIGLHLVTFFTVLPYGVFVSL